MLATVPVENLPSTLSMWINPIAMGLVVFLIAQISKKFLGPRIEKGWYSLFAIGFIVLFCIIIGFLAINNEIRKELIMQKGWFYLLSLSFPSLLFSMAMFTLSRKTNKHIKAGEAIGTRRAAPPADTSL
jgi:hypothetical protein